MDAETSNLFLILKDNHEWINKHGDEFMNNMKAYYSALPDDNKMKAQVLKELQMIEIIPEMAKDFKITKTHQSITSYFMSQVFNGYQNSIVYYVDDIIQTYISFMNEHSILDESTIESIHKLDLSDEKKFKMELFLRSSRLIFISGQAHSYILNSIFTFIHDSYFRIHDSCFRSISLRNTSRAQDKAKVISDTASKPSSSINKTSSDEDIKTANDSSEPGEIKYAGKHYRSPNEHMNENQFQAFVEDILRRYYELFDYVMILELAGDNFSMDFFNHIEEMNMEIFKYVYDFIYLNEKTSEENNKLLDMLKREEIIEILHLIKLPIRMEEPSQTSDDK